MKQLFYLMVIVLVSTNTFAQDLEKPTTRKQFDLAFDAFQLAERGRIAIDFDYHLKKNTALSFNASYGTRTSPIYNNFSEHHKYASVNERVKVGLGYKIYFSKKENQGFYTNLGTNYAYGFHFLTNDAYGIRFEILNLNFKLGYKYVAKHNLFIDAFIETAHPIFGKNIYSYTKPGINLDYGIKIGKRF